MRCPRDGFVKPYHRFIVGVALRLLAKKSLPGCLSAKYVAKGNTWKYGTYLAGDSKLSAKANLLPLERDPLRLLRDCEISRFLTTNYDHEIDHCLTRERLTQEHVPRFEDSTQDQLAWHWRSLTFDRHHVGQMLALRGPRWASSGRSSSSPRAG